MVAGAGLLGQPRRAAAKKKGGTLTVGMPNDWNTFDPHNLSFANFTLQQNLYDTLIRYDQTLKPLPGLAERWTVAPDGQSVTLNLRQGVKFHSGKDLTGADVVKNFEKAADKDRGFNMLPAVANVAEVTAPDAETVLIKFKKVSPEITDLLQAMAIIEPSAMDSLKNRGSGTGPFKFVEWVPGDRTALERNHGLLGPAALGRPAWSSRSSATPTPWWPRSSPGSATSASPCRPRTSPGCPGSSTWSGATRGPSPTSCGSTATKPPFDKKEARQALHYAIDRKGIVDNVLFGVSQPTVLPYSRHSAAYDRSALDKYPFDLNRAKELLGEGRPAGRQGRGLVLPQFPELPAIAQVIKADLAKIGFTLDLVVLDSTQYYKRMLAGDFQDRHVLLREHPEVSRRGSPSTASTARPTTRCGATTSRRRTSTPSPRPARRIDPAKQKAAFGKLNAAILDEAWVVSIAYRQSVFGLAKHVDGFAYTVDDMAVLENVSLEK